MALTDRATRIIAKRGRAVTLQRGTQSLPDAFGDVTYVWTDHPATAATARFTEELTPVFSALFETGDLRLFMSVDVAVTPEPEDRVIAEGQTYRVLMVSPIGNAGQPHVFELLVRQTAGEP